MSTARDHIKRAMRLIGAIATGETPSADEQSDGLTSLNGMLSSWSTERLTIYAKVREVFTFVPGQAAYTIGAAAADFITARPLTIDRATVLDPSVIPNIELPIEIINIDRWADIRIKSLQNIYPTRLYVENTNPLKTLNFYPVPSAAKELVLYSEKALTQIASANTLITLPEGYDDALDYNLAIRLAPEYGKSISAEVMAIATETKANIKRMNIKEHLLQNDAFIMGKRGFNILAGE